MQKHTSAKFLVALSTVFSTLALVGSASADTIDLMWDPHPQPQVIGYVVHVGTQSGTYTQHIDVGPTTAWSFTSAVAGQQYCFTVTAYVSGSLEGAPSNEACGFGNAPPVLANPGSQSSKVGQPANLQLVGSDPKGDVLTYGATGLPAGLTLMASTGYISGTPTTVGSYSVKATASDGVLTTSQTFTWSVTAVDTTAPVVTITGPTSTTTYSTTATTMSLAGTASDNVGVTRVTWVNSRGGSGTMSGTSSWTVPSIALQSGSNVVTVMASDAAGNTSSDALSVTVASDTIAPAVTITSPTTAATFKTTAATLTLGGTASDNVAVTQVSWANNRGGSGTAAGTTTWTASVALQTGSNVLTVVARDLVGNTKTATITVTLNTPPTLSGVASQTSVQGRAVSMQLSGADPDGDVLTYGANGLPPGIAIAVATGLIGGTPTVAGTYPVTVTVSDGMQTATRTFTWTVTTAADTIAPIATITTPTTAATFSTSSAALSLGGTASDNVSITQVTWTNSRGGSGTAAGTTNWSASVALQSGSNVVTITARDASGNTATDTITVTYNAVDSTKPVLNITTPAQSSLSSTAASLTVSGNASDNLGVAQVTWRNTLGWDGTATGTANWSANVKLWVGVNVITISARDAAGNVTTKQISVTKP
jgi:hypothetical protein